MQRRSNPGSQFSIDYAWLLLLEGRNEEGLAQMLFAAYTPPRPLTLSQRILGVAPRAPRLAHPLDLAHALVEAGQLTEASATIANAGWVCKGFPKNRGSDTEWAAPQLKRLEKTVLLVCPAEAGPTKLSSN